MTVDQTKVVDFISVDKTGSVVLTVSDHLEWSSDDHLFQLQEKVNSYLVFIESGELLNEFPNAASRPIRIEVVCKFSPDGRGTHFLSHFRTAVAKAGFGFSCRTLDGEVDLLDESELKVHWDRIDWKPKIY